MDEYTFWLFLNSTVALTFIFDGRWSLEVQFIYSEEWTSCVLTGYIILEILKNNYFSWSNWVCQVRLLHVLFYSFLIKFRSTFPIHSFQFIRHLFFIIRYNLITRTPNNLSKAHNWQTWCLNSFSVIIYKLANKMEVKLEVPETT